MPTDTVEVNGKRISASPHEYILLNKPKDTITTKHDPKNRRTVMDLLALPDADKGSLFPVGRLDRDTSGVLLVTNDGELAHRLMHPRYEVDKLYRVCTRNTVKPHELDLLRKASNWRTAGQRPMRWRTWRCPVAMRWDCACTKAATGRFAGCSKRLATRSPRSSA